ncbi:MAG: phosphotransferase enzyme family protein [Planctomycetota bacterium]
MTSEDRPSVPLPHVGPVIDETSRWERFGLHELAVVLSHYRTGVIRRIRPYPRGSRKSPKLRIETRRHEYLLKRRAVGRDDPARVAFAHELQIRLADHEYPVAGLIGTTEDNNSMLEVEDRIYELFNFIVGRRFDRSVPQATASGAALGDLHRILADHQPQHPPPGGTFHSVSEIPGQLARIPDAVAAVEPGIDGHALEMTCASLAETYREAVARVEQVGYRDWRPCLLHGDWHPGNLLFREGEVVAVLDFDSARMEPRLIDVANGALQFSMRMSRAEQPLAWPPGMDAHRIRALVAGYDQASGAPLDPDERRALPWLMAEALIVESVIPIAATGSFARISGSEFLEMVRRKIEWLRPRAQKLSDYMGK